MDAKALEQTEAFFANGGNAGDGPLPYSISKVDVSKKAEVDAWVTGIVSQFGRLDGAANIAGVIGKNITQLGRWPTLRTMSGRGLLRST